MKPQIIVKTSKCKEASMKASEYCNFFEFTLYKEDGIIDDIYDSNDGKQYHYIAIDNQGVFSPRYAIEVNDLIAQFESCYTDYIDSDIEEYGFTYNESLPGTYYEQALIWLKNNQIFPYILEVIETIVSGQLIDDTKISKEI